MSIAIVGAGPVGCLAGIAFAKKGYDVKVFDMRHDPRAKKEQSLRSINLAVSDRAIQAVRAVDPDLLKRLQKSFIPMHGRMIHDLQGGQTSQKYGLYGEAINSVDRSLLNRLLLDELCELTNVELFFDHKLESLVIGSGPKSANELVFHVSLLGKKARFTFDHVIGADGAYSAVRHHMQRHVRMDFANEYIEHAYVELRFPSKPDGQFALDPNHLHIWPRHEHMLIALPNPDGSFTSTLFAPVSILESLGTDASLIARFFTTNFPDAIDLIGGEAELHKTFESNPRGYLMSVRCSPYNVRDKVLIVGDAAHNMVPFYGQGMNCGFEDIRVLQEILDSTQFNFAQAFDRYSSHRVTDAHAIVRLALDNYVEMRHKVTTRTYLVRKFVDGILGRVLGDLWLPLYTMVSFRADVPYSVALQKHNRQSLILKRISQVLALFSIVLFLRKARHYLKR